MSRAGAHPPDPPVPRELIAKFQANLAAQSNHGQCHTDHTTRSVMTTHNSVYEVMPKAVLYPAEPDDVNRILRVLAASGMPVSARGGGMGTNGQALTEGAQSWNCSRYLRVIENVDPEAGITNMQSGFTLDEPNTAAGHIARSSRDWCRPYRARRWAAWPPIDASEKGKRIHGDTSVHNDVWLADRVD